MRRVPSRKALFSCFPYGAIPLWRWTASFGFHRIPPQSLEMEQATLGAMLIDRAAIEKAAEILRPDDFYRDAHRTIFEAILSLIERDTEVDLHRPGAAQAPGQTGEHRRRAIPLPVNGFAADSRQCRALRSNCRGKVDSPPADRCIQPDPGPGARRVRRYWRGRGFSGANGL